MKLLCDRQPRLLLCDMDVATRQFIERAERVLEQATRDFFDSLRLPVPGDDAPYFEQLELSL